MNQFIIYKCDKKQCENCSFPQCAGTTHIKHAINFVAYEYNDGIYYTEKSILLKLENENQKSKEENQKKKMKIQRRKSKKENGNSKEKNEVLEDVKE